MRYDDGLNEKDNKEGTAMLEELKTKVEELLGKSQEVQAAVQTAVEAASVPSVDTAIVAALVAALEAQGYSITPPAAPAA